MIYTIGHKATYKKTFNSYGHILKTGKREPCPEYPEGYEGGYAFLTEAAARQRIAEAYQGRGFAVFGLEADWEKDTEQNSEGWWHNLLVDAEIVFL